MGDYAIVAIVDDRLYERPAADQNGLETWQWPPAGGQRDEPFVGHALERGI